MSVATAPSSTISSNSPNVANNKLTNFSQMNRYTRYGVICFHTISASTYTFALCWQNVSDASAQLYLNQNAAVRVFGKWRFLTYNCLVMQFVAYSLCLSSHFFPRLRKSRDYFFTTFAFPIGMLVVTSFWSIWFVAGREYIFPIALQAYYPNWLNHITHTIIAPINLIELVLVRKNYPSEKKAIGQLMAYMVSYSSFLLYIRFKTGRFVYPFLNEMDAVSVGAFMVGMSVFTVLYYKSGKLIHDFIHGVSNRCGFNNKNKNAIEKQSKE